MNGIDTIITELETVAGIFPSEITSFGYGELSSIDENKAHPLLWVDSGQITGSTDRALNNGLPNKKTYSVRIFLFDTYSESEQATTDLSAKYQSLEAALHQYLAKVYRRGLSNTSALTVNAQSIETDFAQQQHSDNLVSVGTTVDIAVISGNCDEGVFTDIDAPALTSITGLGNGARLAWTDNSDNETGFVVERSVSYTGQFVVVSADLPAGTTSYDDLSITDLQTYYWRVKAFNATGSAYSNILAGSSAKAITIYNDKATPQELLSDLTEDTTLPNMTVVVHSALGSSQSLSVAVPPDGSTLHVHLEDSNGDDASIPVGTTTYNENIDHIFVPLGNIAITDSVDSFISAQFLIGQTPRTTIKDQDGNTLTTTSFTKVGANGLDINTLQPRTRRFRLEAGAHTMPVSFAIDEYAAAAGLLYIYFANITGVTVEVNSVSKTYTGNTFDAPLTLADTDTLTFSGTITDTEVIAYITLTNIAA